MRNELGTNESSQQATRWPRNPVHIGILLFTISIPASKEASITEDNVARESVKIYSDGSAFKGKVGAAAVLTCPGHPHKILHYHLGLETEHTVHEAELIGTVLALHLICHTHICAALSARSANSQGMDDKWATSRT